MSLATIQSKLVAAQKCHPNAVQTLVAEALDEIDNLARAGLCMQIAEPTAAAPADDRAAFEAWARSMPVLIRLHRHGEEYESAFAQVAWAAWQAKGS